MQRSNPTSPNRENKSLEIKSADAFRRFYRLVKALGFVLKEKKHVNERHKDFKKQTKLQCIQIRMKEIYEVLFFGLSLKAASIGRQLEKRHSTETASTCRYMTAYV